MISQTSVQIKEIKYPVINQIKAHVKGAWKFTLESYSSACYKKFTLVISMLEEVRTLAENLFASILNLKEIKFIKDFAFSILTKIAKAIKKISTVFKFIFLPKVQDKIKKDIKNKNKIVGTLNRSAIYDAKLKSLSLIGKCLKIPKTIYNFFDLTLGKYAPKVFKLITKQFKQIFFPFSVVSMVSKKRALDSTNILFEEFQRAKYLDFIQQYQLTTKTALTFTPIDNLTNNNLKKRIKAIKVDLDQNTVSLMKISANRAYLKAVSQKVTLNPDLVKTHFKISIKKKETNFFSQLEQIEDRDNVAKAVKSIKNRLSQKLSSDQGAIVQKIIGFSIAFLEAIQAIGFAWAPLLPIATAISGVTAVLCGVQAYQEFKTSIRFKENMTKIVAN